jgi:GR25 family glycosyltransferase involved in LPS biosynthesis
MDLRPSRNCCVEKHRTAALTRCRLISAAMEVIPVYVISLADAHVRRVNMKARLDALGIPFQFVDAIDGRKDRLPDVFDGARVVREGFWGEAPVACAASHRLVHRMIVNGHSEFALVLEDDADLASDFCEVLTGCLQFLEAHPRVDMFKLEGTLHSRRFSLGRIAQRSIFVGMYVSGGSAAYLLRRSAAQRFCNLRVMDMAIDVLFGDSRLDLRVFELDPFPAFQDGLTPAGLSRQFGRYGPAPFHFMSGRRPRFQRLIDSARKRWRMVRVYGAWTALRICFKQPMR